MQGRGSGDIENLHSHPQQLVKLKGRTVTCSCARNVRFLRRSVGGEELRNIGHADLVVTSNILAYVKWASAGERVLEQRSHPWAPARVSATIQETPGNRDFLTFHVSLESSSWAVLSSSSMQNQIL